MATSRTELVLDTGAATVGMLLSDLETRLARVGVRDAAAEARDLVAAVLDEPRFWPVLHRALAVPPELKDRLTAACARRASGAPFAYAAGRSAFRFLTLAVDERVLIPRQETELLVDLVLAHAAARRHGVAADIGTGSGALALALATEGTFARVIATDVSTDALTVARQNAALVGASIDLRLGSVLDPLGIERVDVIVANPPYIAFSELAELPSAVRDWEPIAALVCGEDGLATTAAIVRRAPERLTSGGLLALEVDSRRAGRVHRLVAETASFLDVAVRQDLTGRDRFVLATRI
jgi:release factor glutamine methyltransferase